MDEAGRDDPGFERGERGEYYMLLDSMLRKEQQADAEAREAADKELATPRRKKK